MEVFKIESNFILKSESKVKKIKSEIKLFIDNFNKFECHICVMVGWFYFDIHCVMVGWFYLDK